MGASFAKRVLARVKPHGPVSEVRKALSQFVALCNSNSSDGYVEATYESLGLIARTLYPHLVQVIDREIPECYPDLLSYFWHGIGRAIYFAPTNFPPFNSSPWRAVEMSQREPVHEVGRLNALAGLVWALTLVNIRQPQILENLLKHHRTELMIGNALANGASSAIMIWHDSTVNDPDLDKFLSYQPKTSDSACSDLWIKQVREPCRGALRQIYPALKEHDCLGEAFRYQSLAALVNRLRVKRQAKGQSLHRQTAGISPGSTGVRITPEFLDSKSLTPAGHGGR